jgi:hypothetical protein
MNEFILKLLFYYLLATINRKSWTSDQGFKKNPHCFIDLAKSNKYFEEK